MLPALQHVVMQSLLSDDPPATLRRLLAEEEGLSADERERLARIDPDGLRLTALLVRKLRFERVTRSDPELETLFLERPDEFLSLFAAYTAEVPPTAYFLAHERELLRRWQERAGADGP